MPHAFKLSLTERQDLETIVRCPSEEHGVARRANAILLLDKGWSHAQVAEALFLSEGTIGDWQRLYRTQGLDALLEFHWAGHATKLSSEQEAQLVQHFKDQPPTSTQQVGARIKQHFEQDFSRSGLIALMKRLGFAYKKPKLVSGKADEKAQEDFINHYNSLQNSLASDEAVYFADAVHPEHQVKPSFGWYFKDDKPALKSNSSRQRLNLHGAINLETGDYHMVDALTIDACSTRALLEKIEAANPKMRLIHVYLDNARYHHAKILKPWLQQPDRRVVLHFLPPYAPHLNPIERLWGVMHSYVTHNRYYERLSW